MRKKPSFFVNISQHYTATFDPLCLLSSIVTFLKVVNYVLDVLVLATWVDKLAIFSESAQPVRALLQIFRNHLVRWSW